MVKLSIKSILLLLITFAIGPLSRADQNIYPCKFIGNIEYEGNCQESKDNVLFTPCNGTSKCSTKSKKIKKHNKKLCSKIPHAKKRDRTTFEVASETSHSNSIPSCGEQFD